MREPQVAHQWDISRYIAQRTSAGRANTCAHVGNGCRHLQKPYKTPWRAWVKAMGYKLFEQMAKARGF